jgi:hypothetical protein
MENYDDGRSVRQKKTPKLTSQCIGQSTSGIPWHGKQTLDKLERKIGN